MEGLSRSYHALALTDLPEEVRKALLHAGRVGRAEDGTLIALSALGDDPVALGYTDSEEAAVYDTDPLVHDDDTPHLG